MATNDQKILLDSDIPEKDPGISLDTDINTVNINPELIDNRSQKFDYALKNTPARLPYETIKQIISSNQENELRKNSSSILSQDLSQKRYEAISEAINAKNGPLSAEDMVWIDGTNPAPFVSPDSVMEQEYSKNWFSEINRFVQDKSDDNFWKVATQETPFLTKSVVDLGSDLLSKREILLTVAQDLASRVEGQGLGSYLLDWVTSNIVPGRYNLGVRGNINTGFLEGGLTKENLKLQRDRLYRLPVDQFGVKLREISNNLAEKNPQLALMFVTQMLGQSTSDEFLNTVNDVADIATLASFGGFLKFGKAGVDFAKSLKDLRKVSKDVVKATGSPEIPAEATIKASIGDVSGAATETALSRILPVLEGKTPVEKAENALGRYFRIDAQDIASNPAHLGDDGANVIVQDTLNTLNRVIPTLRDVMKVEGIPGLANATREQLNLIKQTVVDRYPGLRNRILDIEDPVWNDLAKAYDVTFSVGKRPGELFFSPNEIQSFLKNEGILDAVVERKGVGYYFKITRPIKETETAIGDFIAGDTAGRPTAALPESVTSVIPFFSHLRTAEDTFSLEHAANRKAATYPIAKLYGLAQEESKLISTTPGFGSIKKKEWQQLRRVLEENQNEWDYTTDRRGKYYKNVQELSETYVKLFHRTPNLAEARAYFAVKRISEIDRVLREQALYHSQYRLGAETVQIVSTGADGSTIRSPAFSAVPRDKLPGGNGNILIMADTLDAAKVITMEELEDVVGKAEGKVKSIERIPSATKESFNEDIAKGKYKLYEIYDEQARPLAGWVTEGDKRIRYVLAKNIESKALDWNQVPRLGGGHFDYNYTYYIKQANIQSERIGASIKNWYEGDTTVMPVSYMAIAKDLIPHMNEVRRLLDGGKIAEAKAYVRKKLPMDAEEFVGHFFSKRTSDGKIIPALLNTKEDFKIVHKSMSVIDTDQELLKKRYGASFRDGTKSGLARNFQIEYTGMRDARDLFTVKDVGTKNNPIYQINTAELVDPITSMNRAFNRIVRSSTLNDYKDYAVRSWLQEAAPWIKEDFNLVSSSPYYYFNNANKDFFIRGIPLEKLNQLMANKFKIQQLVGVPNLVDNFVYRMAENIKEVSYKAFGPKFADRIVPDWLISKLRDPFAFIRSVTFHAYLGLFSIPQMFVQNMTYVNIFAQSPRYATVGTMGAFFHQLSRLNKSPEIIAKLDEFASKVHIPGFPAFKPGEFTEAMNALDRTGFGIVAGEYTPLDTMRQTKIISGGTQKFLGAGLFFFKEGEKNVRYGAWYTAFKEWRDANPTGKITNADLVKIINRADLLYGNMSSASNSVLNSGILSMPTQFYNYTIRLAELFTSKRIGSTLNERLLARGRILAANAGMFGVPMAFGAAGLPVADYLRREMLQNGFFGATEPYVMDKETKTKTDWIETMFMEGIPATILALATGKYYNIGPRYGSSGLTQINEALGGDASFWKLAMGASYTLTTNFFTKDLQGFGKAMVSILKGETKEFGMVPEDFVDILKEASSVKRSYALIAALNTGKWINNNADYVDDVTWKDAIFRYVTGLSPQGQMDVWHQHEIENERREAQNWYEKKFMEEMNRGFLAQDANNERQAQKYFARATGWMVAGDFDPERLSSMLARAVKGKWNIITRSNWEFYVGRTVPASERDKYLRAYEQTKPE